MPGHADLTPAPAILVDGSPLPETVEFGLVEVRVDRSTGSAAAATLRFDDAAEAGGVFVVGANVTVAALDAEGASTDIFAGTVTSLGINVAFGRTELIVGAFDASFRLGQQTVIKSHLEVSAAYLIETIAAEASLSATVDASLRTPIFDSVQQTGTPHQFLTAIARATGCEWFVDGDKLVVRKRTAGSVVSIIGPDELRRFNVRYSAIEDAKDVTVRGWDPAAKRSIVGKKKTTGRSSRSTVPVMATSRGKLKAGKSVSFQRPTISATAAEASAQAAVGRMEAAMLTGRGEVDINPAIVPGAMLEIDEVAPDWNGEYYVTAVEHSFGSGQPFVTRFTIGGLEPTTLVDLFGGQESTSAGNVAGALTIGVVTNVQDDEGLCRVKVNLPYLDDRSETGWARVSQLGAGKNRGWVAVPEVDDEVVVGFENGDLNRPIVLGGLWNAKDAAPIAQVGAGGKIESRSFTSRSGHELMFSDVDGDDDLFISITTGDTKSKLFIGQTKIELHATDTPIEIKTKDAQINLTEQGAITLKGKDITLAAQGKLALSGKTGVEIKSDTSLKVEGAMVDVKAKGKAAIDGGGMTEIKGGMVKVN